MIRRLRQHRPCSIRVATPLTFFSTTFSSFSTATTNTTNNSDLSDPDFTDTKTAYGGLSTSKLVRGWAVLKICSIDAIVVNSEFLLATSRYCQLFQFNWTQCLFVFLVHLETHVLTYFVFCFFVLWDSEKYLVIPSLNSLSTQLFSVTFVPVKEKNQLNQQCNGWNQIKLELF